MGKLAKEFLQKHLVKAANGARPSVYACNRKKIRCKQNPRIVSASWAINAQLTVVHCNSNLWEHPVSKPLHPPHTHRSTLGFPWHHHPRPPVKPLNLTPHQRSCKKPFTILQQKYKNKSRLFTFSYKQTLYMIQLSMPLYASVVGFFVFLWNKAAVTLPGRPVYVVLWLVCVYWALKSHQTGSQPHLGKKRSQRSKR